jgi:RNA polymerase sigma factor (sigma-70 family)
MADRVTGWGADARYTRLIEEHGEKLLHLAIMLTGNRHDGEDVLQEVLISAASAWPITRPLPYLKKAISNRAIDVSRKRHDILTDSPPERAFDELGFLRLERHREFFALLQGLPQRQRETLVLRYYADFDDATIAKLLGITVQTVRSQAHHALTKLRSAHLSISGKEES